MGAALDVIDQTPSGKVIQTFKLRLVSERISARELVAARVRQEVQEFNRQKESKLFQGLVQPKDAEVELNGYRLKKLQPIDADAQVERVLAAFDQNGFLLLVDERQVTELDDQVVLTPGSRISFVKLIPLVGG